MRPPDGNICHSRSCSEANPRTHRLVFFDPLGIPIRHKIHPDVMFKEYLEAREHQREPLSRGGHLFHKFVPSPVKPASVMLTNVVPSSWGANTHSTVLRPLYPGHSITMCLFGSMAFAVTGIEMSYISQSH